MKNYVIGLDYGSDSVRAVLIDTENGHELASDVCHYKRWKNNEFCEIPEKYKKQIMSFWGRRKDDNDESKNKA